MVARTPATAEELVAVVLGEQSRAMRRERATGLWGAGFKRYFWKSLFGTSIDGLAIQQASLTDGPPHLKDAISGVAEPKLIRSRGVVTRRVEEARRCQHRRQLAVCRWGQERAPKRFIGSVGFVPTTDTEADEHPGLR